MFSCRSDTSQLLLSTKGFHMNIFRSNLITVVQMVLTFNLIIVFEYDSMMLLIFLIFCSSSFFSQGFFFYFVKHLQWLIFRLNNVFDNHDFLQPLGNAFSCSLCCLMTVHFCTNITPSSQMLLCCTRRELITYTLWDSCQGNELIIQDAQCPLSLGSPRPHELCEDARYRPLK